MKELKFEELSTRQKLGMTFTACIHGDERPDGDDEFVFDLIKNHSLGAVWIQYDAAHAQEQINKVKAIADYPILIITDCESGIGEFLVGKHNAIGTTGSEKHAYAFGKTIGVAARKMGYNVLCNPVVDMGKGSMRSLGVDKDKVSRLAIAEAKGMRDGGVLTVAKHYPGGSSLNKMDSHMGESRSADTKEILLDYALTPYLAMDKAGVLDGAMISHKKYINIDNEHPGTLSKPLLDIIREQGYEGFLITDALCMMAVKAKYDDVESKALAMNAGVDLLLPYTIYNREQFESYCEAYDTGMISDECLDVATKRVLAAQHRAALLPTDGEVTEEEMKTFKSINKDGIYIKKDDDVESTISRDGKHFFIIVAKQETSVSDGKVAVDTFSGNGWHQPDRIVQKINELFPNAKHQIIHEFPSQFELMTVLENSLGCDKLVMMTFSEFVPYTGLEHLTRRLVNLIDAMQTTGRISNMIHYGNPYVLEELPHIPNIIFGGHSLESVDTCLEVLAGVYPANGEPTYNFKLK